MAFSLIKGEVRALKSKLRNNKLGTTMLRVLERKIKPGGILGDKKFDEVSNSMKKLIKAGNVRGAKDIARKHVRKGETIN